MALQKPSTYLSMTVRKTIINPYNSGMPPGSADYIATLACDGRKMEVYQSVGPGGGEPVLDHVIDFLIDDVKGMLTPWDSKSKDWYQRFDRNAMEVRATNFATLIGPDRFAALLKHIGVV